MAKYITIDEVVASAITILAGSTDAEKIFMRHWTVLGNRELGLSKDNVVTEKINVQDFTIRKPENLLSIDDIGLYNENDVELTTIYKGYGEMTHTDLDSISGSLKLTISISEDDEFLHLSSNGESVDYAKIRYYSIPICPKGDPLILERKRLAIMFFLSYMWTIRQGSNQAEVDRAELRWLREAAKQRSKNKMPSVLEAKSIATWYMSLINTPEGYGY
jgi:hypothetical protein